MLLSFFNVPAGTYQPLVRSISKGNSKQFKNITGFARIEDDDLVFCRYDGSPYLPDRVTHACLILTRRSGLKGIRLHDARHTMATIMLEQLIHPKIVHERLVHASIKTTLDTHSHVAPGLRKAAALKFDDMLQPKTNKLVKELNEITRN